MSFVSKLNIRKVTVYECNEAPSNIVHEKISARHNGKLLINVLKHSVCTFLNQFRSSSSLDQTDSQYGTEKTITIVRFRYTSKF